MEVALQSNCCWHYSKKCKEINKFPNYYYSKLINNTHCKSSETE